MRKIILSLFLIILFSGCIGQNNPIACTQEAKMCPDGTAVGRVPPNCEFAPCPSTGSLCHNVNGLPDINCTPGAIDTNVTQDNIHSTICVSGYTKTVRPSTSWTNPRKVQSIKDYGYTDTNISDYEYDHLISLELGGAPQDTKNLWAEPYYGINNSRDKDKLENYLHEQVCSGKMNLTEAQRQISTDWVKYSVLVGLLPD